MKKILTIAAAVSALTIGAAAAQSRGAPSLAVGHSVTGAIAESDQRADGIPYDDYALTLAAGQAVEIRMSSTAFDSVVEIGRSAGGSFEGLASDDDGAGEGGNSKLRFTASEAGQYVVRARGYTADARGEYQVSVAQRVILPPPAAVDVTVGQAVTGTLADGGPRLEDTDRLYALYRLTGAKGDRLRLTMTAESFDTFLEIGREANGAFESLASDDDSAGNLDSRLLYALPESGSYVVRAQALGDGGAYELKVETIAAPGRPQTPRRLRAGTITSGALADTDAAFDDFNYYDLYALRGRAGETRTVSLRSQSFDSFLEAGSMTPAGFAVASSDDDSGGNTDAKLTVTFEKPGTIILRARALSAGALGEYSISVE